MVFAQAPAELEKNKSRPPIFGAAARLRERAAFVVMAGGNIFSIITVTVLAPVLALIGDHFADRPDALAIAGVFGKGASGPLIAQLMITLLGIGVMVGGPIAGWLAEQIQFRRPGQQRLAEGGNRLPQAAQSPINASQNIPVLRRPRRGLTCSAIEFCDVANENHYAASMTNNEIPGKRSFQLARRSEIVQQINVLHHARNAARALTAHQALVNRGSADKLVINPSGRCPI